MGGKGALLPVLPSVANQTHFIPTMELSSSLGKKKFLV